MITYKQYGNTDMKMSSVGFGAMRFNMKDIRAGNLEKCAEIVRYAYDKGINYFDTAPFYCDEKSEIVVGMGLEGLPRDSFYVSTKTNFGTLYGEPTRENFFKRLHESLKNLKMDYIDFYHIWCVLDLKSYNALVETLYPFLEEARSQGLIRNIVFSSHMQSEDLLKPISSGKFKGMLIGYNALNYRFRQAGIEEAYKNGMGIVVMNPLSGGLIPENVEQFKYLAEGTSLTVPQAALRFVASHKEVTVALCGFSEKSHVDDALIAVDNLELFPASEMVKKFDNTEFTSNTLCTGCAYCDECPVGIEIPKFMDVYNYKLLGGSVTERMYYHWGELSKEDAAKCIACKKCEKLCTQHLPIVERLQEIANM